MPGQMALSRMSVTRFTRVVLKPLANAILTLVGLVVLSSSLILKKLICSQRKAIRHHLWPCHLGRHFPLLPSKLLRILPPTGSFSVISQNADLAGCMRSFRSVCWSLQSFSGHFQSWIIGKRPVRMSKYAGALCGVRRFPMVFKMAW